MDSIITDISRLRIPSRLTTKAEVAELKLRERILEALPTAWCKGFGLVAIQIGVPVQYALYFFKGQPVHLLNPKILAYGNPILSKLEGCLSIPEKRITTVRYNDIEILNDGQTFAVSGLEAVIVQHEIDHMNGITIYDRAQNPYPDIGRNDQCPGCAREGVSIKWKKCKEHNRTA